MKEQYVGDINDYRKYALLRALAGNGEVNIGVCWMLTPSDGRADGNRLGYLRKPAFREFDPPQFDLLATVMDAPDQKRLVLIEESGIILGATYHNAVLPTPVAEREGYFDDALAALGSCHLIFYDPDNGMDVPSKRKGGAGSNRYVFRDELANTYAAEHSMLIYQHFPTRNMVASSIGWERNSSNFATSLGCGRSPRPMWCFSWWCGRNIGQNWAHLPKVPPCGGRRRSSPGQRLLGETKRVTVRK